MFDKDVNTESFERRERKVWGENILHILGERSKVEVSNSTCDLVPTPIMCKVGDYIYQNWNKNEIIVKMKNATLWKEKKIQHSKLFVWQEGEGEEAIQPTHTIKKHWLVLWIISKSHDLIFI